MPTGWGAAETAVENALGAAVESAARRGAAARGARALHPRGRTFHATVLTEAPAGDHGVDLLDRPGRRRGLVRFSRGGGLPDRWPDVLGVALRLPAGAVGPPYLDLLFSTTLGAAVLARQVPFPRRRIASTYTTIAAYRTRRGRLLLGVLPDPAAGDLGVHLDGVGGGTASLLLGAARRWGRWSIFGRILVGAPLPTGVDAELAFDPVAHSAVGLRPDGLIQRVRAAAYRGSRAGRGAPDRTEPGEHRPI